MGVMLRHPWLHLSLPAWQASGRPTRSEPKRSATGSFTTTSPSTTRPVALSPTTKAISSRPTRSSSYPASQDVRMGARDVLGPRPRAGRLAERISRLVCFRSLPGFWRRGRRDERRAARGAAAGTWVLGAVHRQRPVCSCATTSSTLSLKAPHVRLKGDNTDHLILCERVPPPAPSCQRASGGRMSKTTARSPVTPNCCTRRYARRGHAVGHAQRVERDAGLRVRLRAQRRTRGVAGVPTRVRRCAGAQ
ncbi:hypothetical protein PsYK624_058600 [Phanerochaete sordida]|uniref:Uncharacterized protein n=1 Tax=Phanerochaete sordida TaxID=48140 RepID=A0A9P3LCN2_9APHY|nr:hypothetical protein PsYK624_058600 [Phanerochaete sordida]